jgi:hypothetical protein
MTVGWDENENEERLSGAVPGQAHQRQVAASDREKSFAWWQDRARHRG